MERARECVFTEGLHLVEHILLRPETVQQLPNCNDSKLLGIAIDADTGSTIPVKVSSPASPGLQRYDCLLTGCPDCNCELCWVDNPFEKDPCVQEANPPVPYIPLSDAYSFWATLVLPSWLKRFETSASRDLFMHLLYREAPAHVALNILWLSPREMCEFEECYRQWLAWQMSRSNCDEYPDYFMPLNCDPIVLAQTSDADLCVETVDKRCELIRCLQTPQGQPLLRRQAGTNCFFIFSQYFVLPGITGTC